MRKMSASLLPYGLTSCPPLIQRVMIQGRYLSAKMNRNDFGPTDDELGFIIGKLRQKLTDI